MRILSAKSVSPKRTALVKLIMQLSATAASPILLEENANAESAKAKVTPP